MNYQSSQGFIGVTNGEVFTCQMMSILDTDCVITFSIGFVHTIINPDYTYYYDTCSRTVTFVDLSTVTNSEKEDILWAITDTSFLFWWSGSLVTSRDSLFTYTFPNPVDDTPVEYFIRLEVRTENGCWGSSSIYEYGRERHRITIYPSPKIKIVGENKMCEGDSTWLKATAIWSEFINHQWSWQDADGITQTATGDSIKIYRPGIYTLISEDTSGCFVKDTFALISDNSISTLANALSDFVIYPNPTCTELHIKHSLQKTVDYTVYSIIGQVLFQGNLQEETVINVESLAKGMYYLRILDKTVRFVKY
jgi:hypothetical protein